MILVVHDSTRSRFIYGRDAAAFQGRRLRLQSAEREPLPTIVASASPTCYKEVCEERELCIRVKQFMRFPGAVDLLY